MTCFLFFQPSICKTAPSPMWVQKPFSLPLKSTVSFTSLTFGIMFSSSEPPWRSSSSNCSSIARMIGNVKCVLIDWYWRKKIISLSLQYKWLKLESPRRPRSKIERTATTTVAQNRTAYIHSKTPGDPTKLQRSKSTGSVSTEPRNDGIPWRAAARASRLPYVISKGGTPAYVNSSF